MGKKKKKRFSKSRGDGHSGPKKTAPKTAGWQNTQEREVVHKKKNPGKKNYLSTYEGQTMTGFFKKKRRKKCTMNIAKSKKNVSALAGTKRAGGHRKRRNARPRQFGRRDPPRRSGVLGPEKEQVAHKDSSEENQWTEEV